MSQRTFLSYFIIFVSYFLTFYRIAINFIYVMEVDRKKIVNFYIFLMLIYELELSVVNEELGISC